MVVPTGIFIAASSWQTIYSGSRSRTYRITAPGVPGRIYVKSGTFSALFGGGSTMDVQGKKIQVKTGTFGKVYLGKYYLLD